MAALFSTPGITTFTITIAIVQLLSVLAWVTFTYEFRHIQLKRVAMLATFKSQRIRRLTFIRRSLIATYAVLTLVIMLGTTALYL